jgi:hypothetical protein
VRDGAVRRVVKAVARAHYAVELCVHRALRRVRGERPHALGGECRLCARCCEAPAIQAGRLTWSLRSLRAGFLWWQRVVNGFELVEARSRARLFVFRCAHFDPVKRRCDSYASRPGMCRDYPRLLLWQPDPELLPGCGYRAVAPNATGLRRALADQPLTPEQRERLHRELRLHE